ncbi:MAG: FeoA family protein [Pseudomonadota bacterium]
MKALSNFSEGERVEVLEVKAGKGLHTRLANMGIYPGTVIEVITSSGGGPMLVAKNGNKVALGHGMTSKIFVRKAV